MIETDEALVAASRAGDRLAFEELIRRTGKPVFARLYLEAGNVHEAEDLTQETFLIAFRSIGRLIDNNAFRPWILSIAHSVLIDSVRRSSRKKRNEKLNDADALGIVPSAGPSPPEYAQNNEEAQQVLNILRSMPEEYRQPLALRYLSGSDYETIGRELGLTNGSLRGLLHRGLAMLRKQMNGS